MADSISCTVPGDVEDVEKPDSENTMQDDEEQVSEEDNEEGEQDGSDSESESEEGKDMQKRLSRKRRNPDFPSEFYDDM